MKRKYENSFSVFRKFVILSPWYDILESRLESEAQKKSCSFSDGGTYRRGEEGLKKIIFQRRSCNEKNAKVHKNSPPLPRSSHSNRKASREKIHEKCALKWKSLQTTFNLISVSIVDDDVGSWAVKTLSCWTGEFFFKRGTKKKLLNFSSVGIFPIDCHNVSPINLCWAINIFFFSML